MCLLCTAYVDTGHAPRLITLVIFFVKILQGIGQYIPHKVKELLV